MAILVLSGVIVLVVGGCACVWWASRGGPRWARWVAVATLATGELARGAVTTERRSGQDD